MRNSGSLSASDRRKQRPWPAAEMLSYQAAVIAGVFLAVFVGGVAVEYVNVGVPVVHTAHGSVVGVQETSRNGHEFFAYRGMPYARPPVGELRFKPPQDLESTCIVDGLVDKPPCLQKNYLFAEPKIEGSEDCLYLNVFTRRPKALFETNQVGDTLLPVMVFIHWGGFFAGYSTSEYLGPEYFMDHEVVLVTFNYRLGIFGFLSNGGDELPGNYGLKDQVAALKWVQENVRHFGGNKSDVTIFGQSAGGASVHYHMLSPLSKGLFRRAISMSGTALAPWASPLPDAAVKQIYHIQASEVKCAADETTNSTHEEVAKCLRNMDANELLESSDKFKFFSIDPLVVYLPVVEKRTARNPRPFITMRPVDYIRKRKVDRDVDWIVGLVENEGLIRAEALIRQSNLREMLNNDFDTLMPDLLALRISLPFFEIPITWGRIKKFYGLRNNGIDTRDKKAIESFVNLYTDRSFAYSAYQAARFHSLQGYPVRFYHFNYSGTYSYGDVFAATNETIDYKEWGVSHCDDLLYLFRSPKLFSDLSKSDTDLSKKMVDMFVKFATYGDPLKGQSLRWPKVDASTGKLQHLCIGGKYGDKFDSNSIALRPDLNPERFKFWEELPLWENIEELNQNTQQSLRKRKST